MSSELERILEKLKEETSYEPTIEERREVFLKQASGPNKAFNIVEKEMVVDDEKKRLASFNVIWSENKETMLFFMILSVIVVVVGVISLKDYIIFAGIFSFILSAIVIFLAFYRYITQATTKSSIPSQLLDRIERMEVKIDYLMKEMKKGGIEKGIDPQFRDEIEEIKSVLKTLMGGIKKQL